MYTPEFAPVSHITAHMGEGQDTMDQQHTVDAHAATPPAPETSVDTTHSHVPSGLHSVAVGDWLIGRQNDNAERVVIVTFIEGGRAKVVNRSTSRISHMSAETIYDRYTLFNNRAARLTIGNINPIDRRPRPSRAAGATSQSQLDATDFADAPPSAEPDDAEPVNTVTEGVELTVVNDWPIYNHKATREPTVRDLDIAKRAGLAVPRDIRRTIKALLDAGEVELVPEGSTIVGSDHDGPSPRVYAVKVFASIGSDATREVTEYHMSELAALLLVFRLQTEKAKALRLDVAKTFLLVREGRFEEAARVANGNAAPPQPDGLPVLTQTQLDAIERLRAGGIIDDRTAAVHHALIVSKATGLDLVTPLSVAFGRYVPPSPLVDAITNLPEGKSILITNVPDITGHIGADSLGKKFSPAVDGRWVNLLAKAMGVYGNNTFGKTTNPNSSGHAYFNPDGSQKIAFYYNNKGEDAVRPAVAELSRRYATKQKGEGWESLAHEVAQQFGRTAAE